jgi:hypothetical protein
MNPAHILTPYFTEIHFKTACYSVSGVSPDSDDTVSVTETFAVVWLRRLAAGLSPRRPGFAPGPVHVGFVVEKVALRQFVLRILQVLLSVSFHRGCPYSYIAWG